MLLFHNLTLNEGQWFLFPIWWWWYDKVNIFSQPSQEDWLSWKYILELNYDDVTWAQLFLKSPATRLLFQHLSWAKTLNKSNTPHYWPLCEGVSTGPQGVSNAERVAMPRCYHEEWPCTCHGVHLELLVRIVVLFTPGLILGLRPADKRRRYVVTTSLIGWAQTWNHPWYPFSFSSYVQYFTFYEKQNLSYFWYISFKTIQYSKYSVSYVQLSITYLLMIVKDAFVENGFFTDHRRHILISKYLYFE